MKQTSFAWLDTDSLLGFVLESKGRSDLEVELAQRLELALGALEDSGVMPAEPPGQISHESAQCAPTANRLTRTLQ